MMKTLFPGYYRPSEDEFRQLWDDCVFSFDTNVLLNLYRYKPATADKIVEIFTLLKDRIWLSNQVAIEYLENRLEVISTQRDAYNDIENELSSLAKSMHGSLGKYKYHPFIDVRSISKRIDHLLAVIQNELRTGHVLHPDVLGEDYIWSRLTELFDGKVGDSYKDERLQQIHKEAEQRFGRKVPPGYEDAKKPAPNKYGDVVLWFQLLDYAEKEKKPIIFVTGDSKRDWWLEHKGKTMGPRPELLQEFRTRTNQQFYVYHIDNFIAYAQTYLGLAQTPEVIEEIYDIRNQGSDVVEPYVADIDGDGFDEAVIVSPSGIQIFRREEGGMVSLPVEPVVTHGTVEKFFLSDVDNDGANELVCQIGFDTTFAYVIFKPSNGRYITLKRASDNIPGQEYDTFFDAHIMDYDHDGRLEVVCQPWDAIPDDLIPEDYWENHDREDPIDRNPWGRVSYVWRWNPEQSLFTFIKRELSYIGGR
jgi:hypothetical protein